MCHCFTSLDRDGCSSLKLFSIAVRWSVNPLLPLLKELGPAEVGVSLEKGKTGYHYGNDLIWCPPSNKHPYSKKCPLPINAPTSKDIQDSLKEETD